MKRVFEFASSTAMMFVLIEQYATPILKNSVLAVENADTMMIIERILKLSVVSVVIWLLMFFAVFHSFMNAVAEVMRFGDRRFYMCWWNATHIGTKKHYYYFISLVITR